MILLQNDHLIIHLVLSVLDIAAVEASLEGPRDARDQNMRKEVFGAITRERCDVHLLAFVHSIPRVAEQVVEILDRDPQGLLV